MDQADLVTLRAPDVSVLLLTATRDFFDIRGCWDVFREAKRMYGALGHAERVDLFEYNDTHGFSKPRREAAVRWMRRWLLRTDDAPTEGDIPVAPDRDLLCTASGQVLKEFKGKSVFDLNAQDERDLAAARAARVASWTRDDFLREVRKAIRLPDRIEPAKRTETGTVMRESGTITKLLFDTEPGIRLPGLFFTPKESDPSRPWVVLVAGEGKAKRSFEKLAESGRSVLAIDLRGMGELTPPPVSWARTCGDLHEALLGLYLDRPLLGQRVVDLLSVLEQAAPSSPAGFRLVATGLAGPIALHAAALDPRVIELSVEGSIVSWAGVVRTPMNFDQLTNVVPAVLKVYDLPDLAAALAPRPLTVRSPVYPLAKPIPPEDVQEAFGKVKAAYTRLGAENRLILR